MPGWHMPDHLMWWLVVASRNRRKGVLQLCTVALLARAVIDQMIYQLQVLVLLLLLLLLCLPNVNTPMLSPCV